MEYLLRLIIAEKNYCEEWANLREIYYFCLILRYSHRALSAFCWI